MYIDVVVAASIATVLIMVMGLVWMGFYVYRHVRQDGEKQEGSERLGEG